MAPLNPEQVVSFIVRFYGEITEDRRRWRGQVECVQTGEKLLFKGTEQLLRALEDLSPQQPEENKS